MPSSCSPIGHSACICLRRDRLRREAADRQVRLRRHRPGRGAADRRRPAPPAARRAAVRAAPRARRPRWRNSGSRRAVAEAAVDLRRGARPAAPGAGRCSPAPAARSSSRRRRRAASDSATNTPIWPYHGSLLRLRFIAMSAYRASAARFSAPRRRAPARRAGAPSRAPPAAICALTVNVINSTGGRPARRRRSRLHLAVDDLDRLLQQRAACRGCRRSPTAR